MNERQTRVSSVEEAGRVLEYFNFFHDGFMKRIIIESLDEMDKDLSQSCTGVFGVKIDFAHYNYQKDAAPLKPHDQIVRARFEGVQDILCDFREGFLGNTIIRLSIVPASRRRHSQSALEECLGLQLGRHFYLEEYRRYEFRESQIFTFSNATFIELRSTDDDVLI